jgi:hypothetical protein
MRVVGQSIRTLINKCLERTRAIFQHKIPFKNLYVALRIASIIKCPNNRLLLDPSKPIQYSDIVIIALDLAKYVN